MGLLTLRVNEQKEIEKIKEWIDVQLQKRADLLVLLKYLVKTDLVFHLRDAQTKSKAK